MSWQPTASLELLKFRAQVFSACRAFFAQQGVLEVTTPALSRFATTEPTISSFAVQSNQPGSSQYYLHTSPELPMKRLLAAGSGAIFQLAQVFRDSDHGRYHRPEFTMLEWYRPAWGYQRLMDEVESFVLAMPRQTPEPKPAQRLTYRELFQRYVSLDPFTATIEACRQCCNDQQLAIPENMGNERDAWLDLLLSLAIIPQLPVDGLTFIYDFPESQAALAQVKTKDGVSVAERFELYWGAVELANGFQELTDAVEQQKRFEQENKKRVQRQLPAVPTDEQFLAALQAGMPDCSGVALGMDRLLMCLSGITDISQVIAFADDANI